MVLRSGTITSFRTREGTQLYCILYSLFILLTDNFLFGYESPLLIAEMNELESPN